MTTIILLNHLMLKGDHGLKCLAIRIHYACMLQEQLQIMLPLVNTDLGSSLGKNSSVLVVDILLNQDAIFFMSVVDLMATGIREGTL